MHVIEYKLRFLLNSTTLKIIKIEDIVDSKKMLEFNSSYCDIKKIQGFCTSTSGVVTFPMFDVPLAKNTTTHKVLFCEVAVGNSLFVSKDYPENLDVPSGFDSLITDGTNNIGYLSDTVTDIRKCSYMIKDTRKILPLYEVTFEYDEEFERKLRGHNLCHRCVKQEAVVFCPSEVASFCAGCDEAVHSDSFHKRHERRYFEEVGQKKFICCAYHPSKTVDYFCEECAEPVCTECQISGKHSMKEFARHRIVSFLQACRTARSTVQEGNPLLQQHREAVESEIARFSEAVGTFKTGVAALRKQLEREFRSLMQQLESIESCQRQAFNAQLMDRICKREAVRQMVAYADELDPADLLLAYKNITEQRSNEKAPVFERVVAGKIELQGKLTLKTPGTAEPRLPSNKARDKSVGWRMETMHLAGRAGSMLD